MIRTTLAALMSYWRRNLLQLITLLAGIALATALWSGVQAVNAEARASYDAAAATLGEGRFDHLRAADGGSIDQETFVALRRAGWLVSPIVEGRINGVRVIGLDALTAPIGIAPVSLTEQADLGAFLSGGGQIFGRPDALAALEGTVEAELIADPNIAPQTLTTDLVFAQELLGREGEIDRLLIATVQPKQQATLAEIAPNLTRISAQSGSDIGRLTDSFHLNLTAFGFLSFAVGFFIVHSAIGLAFEQRRPMIRTIRALGVPLNILLALMMVELILFALIAGVAGVILGYFIASALLPDVAATLQGLYGANVSGTLAFRASWWATGLLIALGGTTIASVSAFLKLAKMPLLAGGQIRAHVMVAGRRAAVLAILAAACAVLAVILAATADGLVSGFALLASVLIGAALALPLILDQMLRASQSLSSGAKAQWFWADTRQQLPGLSLALMALLLAMAANVGVSTMVSSFRLTFVDFLDQRLASELYLTVEEDRAKEITGYLEPRVDAILPIVSAEAQIKGVETEVFGARVHSTQRDNWTFLDAMADPWDQVAGGAGILLNEQLARRTDTWPGAIVALGGQSFEVVGVYGDYGNPIGQAIVSEEVFAELYPEEIANNFGLRISVDQVDDLLSDLETQFGISSENVINQAEIKAFSLQVFERTFTVTAALNVLTLAVAGFAILMSLLTLAAMRVPQLAPVWAVGITRRSLGQLELLRALILAFFTILIAVPLGIVLAWVLLAVVNVAAFGWKLPLFLFPADYLQLAILSLLAAALAAFWPALKLTRLRPAELLKVFANER
ncbi:putative ABC transport system permease protein [Cognatiyoonia sediminum]|uniref:Putative ABC transport system permease protein n=1 Tax=Cognatiyoonia sediminum TaxID=1508389 RepID=A0A1M5RFA9_9RHOB|nr:ABC transporter permease [Cognatiyoonia sediminum]SHH24776.1 putative ABC transport system permease protein [Cognatiyoonia sediminum]